MVLLLLYLKYFLHWRGEGKGTLRFPPLLPFSQIASFLKLLPTHWVLDFIFLSRWPRSHLTPLGEYQLQWTGISYVHVYTGTPRHTLTAQA